LAVEMTLPSSMRRAPPSMKTLLPLLLRTVVLCRVTDPVWVRWTPSLRLPAMVRRVAMVCPPMLSRPYWPEPVISLVVPRMLRTPASTRTPDVLAPVAFLTTRLVSVAWGASMPGMFSRRTPSLLVFWMEVLLPRKLATVTPETGRTTRPKPALVPAVWGWTTRSWLLTVPASTSTAVDPLKLSTLVVVSFGATPAEVLTRMPVLKLSTITWSNVPVQVVSGAVPICRPVAMVFAALALVPERVTLFTVTVPTVQPRATEVLAVAVLSPFSMVKPEMALLLARLTATPELPV
jgi:hypothetical protein